MERPSGYGAYAELLKDHEKWPSEELFNAAKAMEDLLVHPGWSVLVELAKHRQDWIMANLDPPNVHEQAKYASLHGMRSGIQQLLDIPAVLRYAAMQVEQELAEREPTPAGR